MFGLTQIPGFAQHRITRFKMAELNQELPRKGGYAAIEFSRGVPKRGPSGWLMILGGGFVMSVGFAMVIRGNRQRW